MTLRAPAGAFPPGILDPEHVNLGRLQVAAGDPRGQRGTHKAGARDFRHLFHRCRDQEFLVLSIDSDHSFPPQEQAKLVQLLKKAHVPVMWITVHSDKGHDSFLLEPRLFTPHIQHQLDHGWIVPL